MPITEEGLKVIERRMDGLVTGPWDVVDRTFEDDRIYVGTVADGYLNVQVAALHSGEDRSAAERHAEFIAHAREDMPRLVMEIRRLRSALESVQYGSCDGCGNYYQCPKCRGHNPALRDPDDPGGHAPDCPIGQALGRNV